MRYILRDRQGGNIIDMFDNLESAKNALEEYESADKMDGIYESYFYEIYDTVTKEIVEM